MPPEPRPPQPHADLDAFFRRAHHHFHVVRNAERDVVQRMLSDYRFVDEDNGQWPEADRLLRGNRPTLQIDRVTGPIQQVLTTIRDARPAIVVHPVDDGADPEKAEVRQGVIRRIETDSFADVAYMTAAEHQLKMGRGWWRIVTEWDEAQPYQHIRILPVNNPFAVSYDPRAQLPDLSDAMFAFLGEDVDIEDYRERFGEEASAGLEQWRSDGAAAPEWFPRGKVHLAEYWLVERERREIPAPDGGAPIVTWRRRVWWYLLNAVAILDVRMLPGPYIPVIPVFGERNNIDGTIDLKGLVRRARDAQRMINHHRSAAVELLSLGSKGAPVVDPKAIAAYRDVWDTRNVHNWSFLPMDSYSPTGQPYRTPDMLQHDISALQAYSALAAQFENDLRAVTGYFDVYGSERQSEQSGRAIALRQRQGEQGNSQYLEHLSRAIRLTGLVLNSWIPVYYDTPRVLRIVGKDNQERNVLVHAGGTVPAPVSGMRPEDVVDLSVGRYDVTVSMGPSLQTKRIEATEQMTAVIAAAPQLLPIIGDLFFKNLDWPEAQQIAERMKKALPPALQDSPAGQQSVPPQVQRQLEQMAAQIAQLTQALHQATTQIETDQAKQQAEVAKKQMELAQAHQHFLAEQAQQVEAARLEAATQLEKARLQAETDLAIAQLKASSLYSPPARARVEAVTEGAEL